MDPHSTTRAEAERLLGIAEKQLHLRDLHGSRDFAILAQETEPLLDGSDQILAIVDTLLASEKRVNNHPDWYSVLQLTHRVDDPEIIKKQYRRLALLLHPDKNKYIYSDSAFQLVSDAWNILSDPSRKSHYDHEFTLFTKVDLIRTTPTQKEFKLPTRRPNANTSANANANANANNTSFWTTCPYCYNLYQYPKIYEGCCLRCGNCDRAFQAVVLPSLPPLVEGKDAYYCCWGFFPMGFSEEAVENGKQSSFPKWVPPVVGNPEPVVNPMPVPEQVRDGDAFEFVDVPQNRSGGGGSGGGGRGGGVVAPRVSAYGQPQKKRGRPRKNPAM